MNRQIEHRQDAKTLQGKLIEAESKRKQGKLKESEAICRKLLELHPTYVGALQTFGLVATAQKNYRQAVTCFLTAAANAPADPTSFTNLAVAWIGLDAPEMAAAMLREALRLDPHSPHVHHLMGDVCLQANQYSKATISYRKALQINPDFAQSLMRLCECCINVGDFEEACDLLRRARQLRPNDLAVASMMLQIPETMLDKTMDVAGTLRNARKLKTEAQEDFQIKRGFLEAAFLDRSKQYEEAWKVLCAANEKLEPVHQQQRENQAAEQAGMLDDANRFDGRTLPKMTERRAGGTCPLFILGPSRSGKTTLESLLASHDDVCRGFERGIIQEATRRTSQSAGLIDITQLSNLPMHLNGAFATTLRQLLVEAAGASPVLATTAPGMIAIVAQLAQALPEARFVFMRRDREDTALRILMKNYKTGNPYSSNLAATRAFLDWYDAITNVWCEKLRKRALMIEYEDMAKDPQTAVRRVTELCSLTDAGKPALRLPSFDVGASAPYRNLMHCGGVKQM
jgi:Flp pilus assembly protein TadD